MPAVQHALRETGFAATERRDLWWVPPPVAGPVARRPESIHITDNAIIPLKERVVDDFYDPVRRVWRWLTGRQGTP